jgi:hypothetical protein
LEAFVRDGVLVESTFIMRMKFGAAVVAGVLLAAIDALWPSMRSGAWCSALSSSIPVIAGPTSPWTWELAEMFKIEKGKIRRIEAILERAPYGMNSGWSNWEDGMSSRARDVK